MERNSTNYPSYVYQKLRHTKESDGLKLHQAITRKYFLEVTGARGLLIFHGLGFGKTRTAASIIKHFRDRRTIILAPSSVHGAFRSEFTDLSNIYTLSLRAGNLSQQIDNLAYAHLPETLTEGLGSLDGCLLVCDEAHILANSITNGSRNAIYIYDLVMSAKNLKILMLSGSPIINDPFELAPMFNMLAGSELFTENKEDFYQFFIKNTTMINRNVFRNRIVGLVSYYAPEQSEFQPVELPLIIVEVPMSEAQYAVYKNCRDLELMEPGYSKREKGGRFNARKTISSYRIKSRKACNLVPIDGASDNDLLNPDMCPKFHKLLSIIEQHRDQIGVVYSDFVHKCGLQDISRLLVLSGWDPESFAILSGDQSAEERDQIVQRFNDRDNISGNKLKLVLLGPAGAEGISFKNARWCVIVGPFYNMTRIRQVTYRLIRLHSHDDLPEQDRNVQIYLMLATTSEKSTDQDMYEQAQNRELLTKQFYNVLVEASVDCMIHHKQGCLHCSPTRQPLFSKNIADDIKRVDPCIPPKMARIQVNEIMLDGKKYVYRKHDDHFEFYKYDDSIDGYTKITRNYPEFDELYNLVKEM